MRLDRSVIAVLFAAGLVAGCGDEDGGAGPGSTQLALSDLVGTWQATGVEAASGSDPSERVDLFDLGATATVKIEASRRIAFVASFDDEVDAATGTLTIGGRYLYIAGDGAQESVTLSCALSQETMTVTHTSETYDFDGDGNEEPAVITMVLEPGEDGFPIADIAGTWSATRWEFTNDANPSETVDVIALGGTATVTVESNGRYTLSAAYDGSTDASTGALQTVGEYLVSLDHADLEAEAFACVLTESTMLLYSTNASYDFDENGFDEDASLTLEFERI